jgi:heme/copper-type cytochrome/quinol oxidase subunit 2
MAEADNPIDSPTAMGRDPRALAYTTSIAFGILASFIMALVLTTGCGSAAPAPTRTPQPTPIAPGTETPTVRAVQELALLENYAATSFFPDPIVVLKGIPVKFYFTRLHREHVNKFTIEPFYRSSKVVLPGEVAILEFLPSRAGQLKIHNVGHGFEATLVVVEDEEEARTRQAEQPVQKVALIYRLDDAQIFPEQVVVEKGIPVKVYNIGLDAEHRVSVPPFYTAGAVNVGLREISTFEFTPDQTGTFTIRDEAYGLEATLIVR